MLTQFLKYKYTYIYIFLLKKYTYLFIIKYAFPDGMKNIQIYFLNKTL